jgi:plastocyanin/uncharacterized membrane protein YozB (DUF420 family)
VTNWLQFDGTPAANANLLLQVVMGIALLIGMVLARQRRFRLHQACQTTVVLLELVLIALVMAPSFHTSRVFTGALKHPGRAYFTVALAHAVAGTVTALLGLYLVLAAGTRLLPEGMRLRSYKPWMRSTLVVWLVTLGLGVATYVVWYRPQGPEPAPATAPVPASQPAAAPGAVVRMTNFKFTPQALTIVAGTTVTWLGDTGTHSVRCDDEKVESPSVAGSERFQHRFDRPGTYSVYCGVHGRNVMASTVTVVAAPSR